MKINIEKIYLWIGSTLGIVISVLTIIDHANKAAPPNLDIFFSYNKSNKLNVVPNINADSAKLNNIIPLDMIITNIGGLSAKNVELSFILPINLEITSDNHRISIKKTIEDNQLKTIFAVKLKDINPYSNETIMDELYLNIGGLLKNSLTFKNNNSRESILNKPISLKFYCIISCADVHDNSKEIYLTIGDAKSFDNRGNSYYILSNKGITIVTNEYSNY